jgi:glutathione S-transferase
LELHPLLKEIYEQISKERPANKERYDYSLKELCRVLDIFNNHLKIRTFFVGDSISVVDISLATHLETAFK